MTKIIRIGVVGNVDSGKSTLVGILKNDILDNGRGLAREKILKHNHEKDTGRTSCIVHHNYKIDDKTIIFIDLAGHEKYLKTTIHGISSNLLDYIILVVGANMGVSRMTKEHFHLAKILNIPTIVVITKIDICPKNIYKLTLKQIKSLIKISNKMPLPIKNKNLEQFNQKFKNFKNVSPIISLSNVTGKNVNILKNILSNLTSNFKNNSKNHNSNLMLIHSTFNLKGIGYILYGTVKYGNIKLGQKLFLGPDKLGKYKEIIVKTLRDSNDNKIDILNIGETGCMCIKLINKKENLPRNLHKGVILTNKPKNIKKFKANIKILHHPTTIKKNYESVIHTNNIRQTARIINIHNDNEYLRSGDNSIVDFEFVHKSEYIELGNNIMFREGQTKGFGIVTHIY